MITLALIFAGLAIGVSAVALVATIRRTNALSRLYRDLYHQASFDRQHIMDCELKIAEHEKILANALNCTQMQQDMELPTRPSKRAQGSKKNAFKGKGDGVAS